MVSVIIPCYNHGHFLKETVFSVIKQTYTNWECIIINDGSTDDTENIAKELCTTDLRIRYLHKNNAGLSAARNTGIAKAVGIYILPLDADDLLLPDYIQTTIEVLESEKNIRLIYTGTQLFGMENGVRNEPFILKNFMLKNLIPCTALFYKEDWKKVNGYNEKMLNGYEDWDFWMSLIENGVNVKKNDRLLFNYRRTLNSMSKNMDSNTILNIQDEIFERHKAFYLKVLDNPLTLSLKLQNQQRELNLIKNSSSFKLAKKISAIYKYYKKNKF